MQQTVKQILDSYELPSGWDVIIIGDGSGCGNHRGIGWSGFLLDKQMSDCFGLCGGQSSCSTVSVAEIMAFWMPLRFHKAEWLDKIPTRRRPIQVVVFSDNESVVQVGNRVWVPKNPWDDIWAGVFATMGNVYDVRFHHVKKEARPIDLHVLSDQLSVGAREWMEQLGGENLPSIMEYVKL